MVSACRAPFACLLLPHRRLPASPTFELQAVWIAPHHMQVVSYDGIRTHRFSILVDELNSG
jgi:hypothetical protein